MFIRNETRPLAELVTVEDVALLRAVAVGHQRCFGRLREAVVADRELVVVFRSGGYSVFKLKLKYKEYVVVKRLVIVFLVMFAFSVYSEDEKEVVK